MQTATLNTLVYRNDGPQCNSDGIGMSNANLAPFITQLGFMSDLQSATGGYLLFGLTESHKFSSDVQPVVYAFSVKVDANGALSSLDDDFNRRRLNNNNNILDRIDCHIMGMRPEMSLEQTTGVYLIHFMFACPSNKSVYYVKMPADTQVNSQAVSAQRISSDSFG